MSIVNIEVSPFDYVNFVCRKGDSFENDLEILNEDESDFDFTGYEAEMNVRQREGMEPVEVFTTTDESIVLTNGNISLSLDEITAPSGSYNYDLKITKGGKSRTIITGYFTIRPEL